MLKQHSYSGSKVLFYPGISLTEAEKKRLDNVAMPVEEARPEYIIYILQNLFANWVHSALEFIEEFEGYEMAAKIAEGLGARHASRGWTAYLRSKGLEHGTPALMAEYQDIAHTYRGPIHTGALFAEFDDRKCIVRRETCIYYGKRPIGSGLYNGAMCDGFMRGYMEADSAIEKIDRRGLCYGNDTCEHVWWFKPL